MGTGLSQLPGANPLHIVLLGLDESGKTTVLYRLKLDEFINAVPTVSFNTEKVTPRYGKAKGIRMKIWDAGGSEKLRPLWKSYTRAAEGIVFVVDSSDSERFEEARSELLRVARYQESHGIPVLVIANKQDLREAVNVDELGDTLGLKELRSQHPCHIHPVCAITGEGLIEAVDALYDMIEKRKRSDKFQKNKVRLR